jgi:hypothetical protein
MRNETVKDPQGIRLIQGLHLIAQVIQVFPKVGQRVLEVLHKRRVNLAMNDGWIALQEVSRSAQNEQLGSFNVDFQHIRFKAAIFAETIQRD